MWKLEENIQFSINQKPLDKIVKKFFRASVRAGGTGGLPPVDLEQRVAATRPDLQPLITMRQKKSDLEEVTDEFI